MLKIDIRNDYFQKSRIQPKCLKYIVLEGYFDRIVLKQYDALPITKKKYILMVLQFSDQNCM